jgi:hypothetical protein
MHSNLIAEARFEFFSALLAILADEEVRAAVVVEDTSRAPAVRGLTPERDVIHLFLERASNQCRKDGSQGFVIVDRPGGGRAEEDSFLRLAHRNRGAANRPRAGEAMVFEREHVVFR